MYEYVIHVVALYVGVYNNLHALSRGHSYLHGLGPPSIPCARAGVWCGVVVVVVVCVCVCVCVCACACACVVRAAFAHVW